MFKLIRAIARTDSRSIWTRIWEDIDLYRKRPPYHSPTKSTTEICENSPKYVKICMGPNFVVQNFKNYERYDHDSLTRVEIHVRWILNSNGLVISYVDPEGVGKNHFFPAGGRCWNNQVQIEFFQSQLLSNPKSS